MNLILVLVINELDTGLMSFSVVRSYFCT